MRSCFRRGPGGEAKTALASPSPAARALLMSELTETHVVTCFLRHRGEVLLVKRSAEVGSYRGLWGGVAGHADGNPDAAAWEEIREETGLQDAVSLVRRGTPFPVEDPDLTTRWIVHPYLFDCTRRDVQLDWETDRAAWVMPTEILHRPTVPEVWTSYTQVAPSLDTIRGDTEHGAAYLSLRALEVLRDRAGLLDVQLDREEVEPDEAREALCTLARQLREARPSMSVLRNRINRVMHTCRTDPAPAAVEQVAHETLQQAIRDDEEAAHRISSRVAGRRVLTLSRSGTVLQGLQQARPAPTVIVAESRPAREGVSVAETLATAGLDVTLVADAALAHVLTTREVDLVLTGADSVLPSGRIVNKTGTHLAALAAREADRPFYAAAATDKIRADEQVEEEEGPREALYDGDAPLQVANPTFEVTPAALVSGLITEKGVLAPADIEQVADELGRMETW